MLTFRAATISGETAVIAQVFRSVRCGIRGRTLGDLANLRELVRYDAERNAGLSAEEHLVVYICDVDNLTRLPDSI